jgi:hypothetical protein
MLLSAKRSKNLFSRQILAEEIPQVCIRTYISWLNYSRNGVGIIMSLSLYHRRETNPGSSTMELGNLSLLAAYENGSVVLREYIRKDKEVSVEGEGWDVVWTSKLHVESSMCHSSSSSAMLNSTPSHGNAGVSGP